MTKTYPKHKPSGVNWLGNIPEHWTLDKLSRIAKFKKGPNAAELNKEYISENSGPYPVFSGQTENDGLMGMIDSFAFNLTAPVVFVTTVGAKAMTTKLLKGKFSLSQNCALILPKVNYSAIFIEYCLRPLFAYERGSISLIMQPSLRFEDLNRFWIPLPPIAEQKIICDFLALKTQKIDELIEKKKVFIERLKEKRTALISQVVTKGLPPEEAKKHGLPENPKMKPSGVDWLGDIPAHWTMKRVKHISTLYGRIGFRGYTVDDLVDEMEGAITLSPGNMFNGKFLFEKTTYISWKKYHESPEIKIYPDDILMVKTGSSFGKIAQIREVHHPMTINPQLIVFKEIKIFHRFLFYYLISPVLQGQVSLSNTGGTIPTMTQANIGNYAVPFPTSIDEQVKVANYLDQETSLIDDLIEKVESAIERLNEYRSAIISSAVTGKIDVRGTNQ